MSSMATASEEAIIVSLGNEGLLPSDEIGEATIPLPVRVLLLGMRRSLPLAVGKPLSLQKKSSQFKGSMSPPSSGSSHMSPFLLTEPHSLLISALTLTVDTL